jgi:hypothetical protein
MTDAFDQWWEWARKPLDSPLTIPDSIHNPVMSPPEEDRLNREKVNEAVRCHRRKERAGQLKLPVHIAARHRNSQWNKK